MINPFDERACRMCGCTDDDCSGCIERTGRPCSWADEDLCTACLELLQGAPARALAVLDALLDATPGSVKGSVVEVLGLDEVRDVRRLIAELAREMNG